MGSTSRISPFLSRKARICDHRVSLDLCEVKDLPTDRTYDVIVMFDVVEHIPAFEMEVVWDKVRMILRPGGFVVFSTPVVVNPNGFDHTDVKEAVHGIHCHKQTLGTIMRTAVKYGFVIGDRNERCFGFSRHADLPLLPSDRRASFLETHQEILAALEAPFTIDHLFTSEDIRSLVPGIGRLLIGCVAENTSEIP